MDNSIFHEFTTISLIDVTGPDAVTIVNNLTTNAVKTLPEAGMSETFVTDVRGKTVGHVNLYRLPDRLRLLGASGQSESVAAHIDRYTIREDATPAVRDEDFIVFALSPAAGSSLAGLSGSGDSHAWSQPLIGGVRCDVYQCQWWGPGTMAVAVPGDSVSAVRAVLSSQFTLVGEADFHRRRVECGFPWYGSDIEPSNLPQEIDRDSAAISFTKGCYLGQETVARLDALGQVQRKLVRWQIAGDVPAAGAILVADDKQVGRLTSVAELETGEAIALGFARRSHFQTGASARGADPATGREFVATVI
jgi:folate-binding protein YgfZ